eukprot:1888886-Pleurochrysis_carterae.AAC.1
MQRPSQYRASLIPPLLLRRRLLYTLDVSRNRLANRDVVHTPELRVERAVARAGMQLKSSI